MKFFNDKHVPSSKAHEITMDISKKLIAEFCSARAFKVLANPARLVF